MSNGILVSPGTVTKEELHTLQEKYEYVFITKDREVILNPCESSGLFHVEDGWIFRITSRAYLENNRLVK